MLAPERTTASGRPFSSVRTLRFVPIFSSVCWILSNRLQGQRRFYHATVQALPLPADPFQFIVLFETLGPDLLKKPRCQPLLKRPVYGASAAIFPGQGFPLTACPQHIEYPLQCFPRWHRLASLPWCMNIFLFRVSFRFRNISLNCFPKFFRYCPRLVTLLFTHFVAPALLYLVARYFGIGS